MGEANASNQKGANERGPVPDAESIDALCEGIGRVIVDSMFHTKPAPELAGVPEPFSELAETGVIAPLGDMVTEKAVSAVEGLLDSDELSGKILRVVQEKIVQVLNEDLAQSRKGDSGVIAERVHLECARLFGRETFRKEMLRLLQFDLQKTVVPTITNEVLAHTRRALAEFSEIVLDRLAVLVRRIRTERRSDAGASSGSPPSPAGVPEKAPAPQAPPAEAALPAPAATPAPAAAPHAALAPRAEPAGPVRVPTASVPEIKREILADIRREVWGLMDFLLGRVTETLRDSSTAIAAPVALVPGPSPAGRAARPLEESVPDRIERIRERLWAEGVL